jgi:hypothetical protein
VVFGLFAVAYVARRGRVWKLVLLASSSCYLTFVTGFPVSRAIRAVQWRGWWVMMSEYPSWGIEAFFYGVALPFLHVTLALGAIASLVVLALTNSNLTSYMDSSPNTTD